MPSAKQIGVYALITVATLVLLKALLPAQYKVYTGTN